MVPLFNWNPHNVIWTLLTEILTYLLPLTNPLTAESNFYQNKLPHIVNGHCFRNNPQNLNKKTHRSPGGLD